MENKQNIKNNMPREDGNATKALLIESAGKLIAEQGYEKTTSKSVCEMAGANIAAVNYHFDSRDSLYVAVLEEVHRYLLNVKELQELEEKNVSAEEKLMFFLDAFILNAWQKECWQVKVWARELINPSPFITHILSNSAIPKLNIVVKIFSEYTGIPKDDPKLYSCILSVMAPRIISFAGKNKRSCLVANKPIGLQIPMI